MSSASFVERLRAEVPEARDIVAENEDPESGVLLHLLMSDLSRFCYEAHRRKVRDVVERTMRLLEAALSEGDHDVNNAVCLSFVSNFDLRRPGQRRFVETWPADLRREAERQERLRPA